MAPLEAPTPTVEMVEAAQMAQEAQTAEAAEAAQTAQTAQTAQAAQMVQMVQTAQMVQAAQLELPKRRAKKRAKRLAVGDVRAWTLLGLWGNRAPEEITRWRSTPTRGYLIVCPYATTLDVFWIQARSYEYIVFPSTPTLRLYGLWR